MTKTSAATVDVPPPVPKGRPAPKALDTKALEHAVEPLELVHDEHLRAGTLVGVYRILEVLGAGGMGAVYLAFDERLERNVALKVLHGHEGDAEALHRLRREARVLAQLAHPQVVQVYEVGADGERAYVAMEYIAGATLRQWLSVRARTLAEIVEVFVAAGRGLDAAHEAGIVHRDFKLDNVLISDSGQVCVVDFGVAFVERPEPSEETVTEDAVPPAETTTIVQRERFTRRGALVGTIPYMATEQLCGGEVGPWSDQFAFFANLYEAIYGSLPWALDSAAHELEHMPPRAGGVFVPLHLRRAIARGLAPERQERFASMAEALRAISLRRNRLKLALLCIPVPIAAGAAMLVATEQPCEAPPSRWSDDLRAQAGRNLMLQDPSGFRRHFERLDAALTNYEAHWRGAYLQLCHDARRGTNSITYDRQMHCLAQRHRTFVAQVRILTDAQSISTAHGLEAALQLPPVDECDASTQVDTTWNGVLPVPEHLAQEAEALRSGLDEVRALERVGHWPAALEEAEQLLHRAQSVGFEPLTNEVRQLVAELMQRLGRTEPAVEMFERVYFGAEVLGQRALAFEAATHLIELEARELRHLKDADRWAHFARSLLISGNADTVAWGKLLSSEGAAYLALEKFEVAAGRYRVAVEQLEQELGPDDLSVLDAKNRLAGALAFSGRADEALEMSRGVLEIQERLFGRDHPRIYDTLTIISNAHFQRDEPEQAEALYRQQIRMNTEIQSIDDRDLMRLWSNLAAALNKQDKVTEAEDALTRAIAFAPDDARGDDRVTLVLARLNLGAVWMSLGRNDEAEAMFHRVLQDATSADMVRFRVLTFSNLAQIHAERGDHPTSDRWREQAWRELVATGRSESADAANILLGWALSLEQQERWDLALARAREAGAILETHSPEDYPETLGLIGRLLGQQGDEEAVPTFEKALALAEARARDAYPEIALDFARLVADDDPRARAAVEKALSLVPARTEDGQVATLEALRQWLREHPARSR